jgi:hypothetical protein
MCSGPLMGLRSSCRWHSTETPMKQTPLDLALCCLLQPLQDSGVRYVWDVPAISGTAVIIVPCTQEHNS